MAFSIVLPSFSRIQLPLSAFSTIEFQRKSFSRPSYSSHSRVSYFRLRELPSKFLSTSNSPSLLNFDLKPRIHFSPLSPALYFKTFKTLSASNMANAPTNMEIEIKLRLPSKEYYSKVFDLLKDKLEATYDQKNVFFDGSEKELSSKKVVLRLRFYNGDEKCIVTVKGNTVLSNGISRTTEEEEEIDVIVGKEALENPKILISSESALIKSLCEIYSVKDFVCLGGFENVRNVFDWNKHKIELDETKFAFGTQYEIECETSEPEILKEELEKFLQENGVSFQYSKISKFGIFRSGKLPN